ncbi:hypothetical protein [Nostoc sp. 'Peltigera malacea cyanobiont' DB3992]|uniref:hypothetical protein n=1 Tax=Nostoc sp. 'Peltigera malacea cyanobiont' DB3992 TaxID=1206980 RepID=UPI000C04D9C5|nr:hypothetical protein [Nostoc sp. 'Peltigera malacea cyanobiont' DB3992]PHM11634.1 hypothetical protein CK516_01460 [Nostoc sp. 'Peltigera malacea cyanobiont' DB3992]
MRIDISTPAIWYPGQSEIEFDEELNLMLERSAMTRDFLNGEIPPDCLLDFINDQGFNVFDVAEDWDLGDGIVS